MTLDQIRAFVAVALTLSFTKAAAVLFSTQQGVSRQISNLESELGYRLFDRTTKKVELTPQGAVLLPHLESALQEVDNALSEGAKVDEQLKGLLRIGIADISYLIAIAKRQRVQLLQEYPEITIQSKIKPVGRLLDMLIAGHVDVIISLGSELSGTQLKNLKTRCFQMLEEYIVISCRHPLADRPDLSLKDMQGETLYLLSHDFSPVAEDLNIDVLKRAGVEVGSICYCDSLHDLELSLYSGKGFAIIPDIFFEDPEETLVLYHIPDDSMGMYRETIVVVWLDSTNKAIRSYTDTIATKTVKTHRHTNIKTK